MCLGIYARDLLLFFFHLLHLNHASKDRVFHLGIQAPLRSLGARAAFHSSFFSVPPLRFAKHFLATLLGAGVTIEQGFAVHFSAPVCGPSGFVLQRNLVFGLQNFDLGTAVSLLTDFCSIVAPLLCV